MLKFLFLNFCLFCFLSIGLAEQNKSDQVDTNKTSAGNDKKVVLEAEPVLKNTPRSIDLKQSESHLGVLYPFHPYYHHYGHKMHHYGHYPYMK